MSFTDDNFLKRQIPMSIRNLADDKSTNVALFGDVQNMDDIERDFDIVLSLLKYGADEIGEFSRDGWSVDIRADYEGEGPLVFGENRDQVYFWIKKQKKSKLWPFGKRELVILYKPANGEDYEALDPFVQKEGGALFFEFWNMLKKRSEKGVYFFREYAKTVSGTEILERLSTPLVREVFNNYNDTYKQGFWTQDRSMQVCFCAVGDSAVKAEANIGKLKLAVVTTNNPFDVKKYWYEADSANPSKTPRLSYESSQELSPDCRYEEKMFVYLWDWELYAEAALLYKKSKAYIVEEEKEYAADRPMYLFDRLGIGYEPKEENSIIKTCRPYLDTIQTREEAISILTSMIAEAQISIFSLPLVEHVRRNENFWGRGVWKDEGYMYFTFEEKMGRYLEVGVGWQHETQTVHPAYKSANLRIMICGYDMHTKEVLLSFQEDMIDQRIVGIDDVDLRHIKSAIAGYKILKETMLASESRRLLARYDKATMVELDKKREEKAKKLISVMDTSFRDGLQSVYGGRVLLEDIKPAIQAFVDAGIRHFECGGGARFQSLYFYCNEDAFDMMDTFRSIVGPDIKLQTLSRGVSHVGLDTGSRDTIELHAKLFKKHGMTTIRNFDALNDVQNLVYPAECIKKYGLNHEVCVTVMELPPECYGAHEADFYMTVLRNILDSGLPFDSVCFKDASGTARPRKIFETIKAARALLGDDMHIRFHTHETAGVSVACYLAALDAGADGIDLAMDPVSGGTSQPDTLTMLHALKGSEYDLGLEAKRLLEAQKVLKECLKDYFVPPEAKEVCTLIPFSPMPGGALTANTQMMRDTKTLDKLPAALEAMGEVVARGGFGTSVTPVSQFYFQQAFNNVVFGPWKKIADGYGKMLLGYFGKTPVAPDAELVAIAKEQLNLEPTTENPLDVADRDFNKSLACFEEQLRHHNLPITEENLFIVGTCADKGIAFLKGEAKVNVRKVDHHASESSPKTSDEKICHDMLERFDLYSVSAADVELKVSSSPLMSEMLEKSWDGKKIQFKLEKKAKADSGTGEGGVDADGNIHIHAPLPSEVIKVLVQVGDEVKDGEDLMILEAMKMVMEVQAPADGIVKAIHVKQGSTVESGQVLVTLE